MVYNDAMDSIETRGKIGEKLKGVSLGGSGDPCPMEGMIVDTKSCTD